MTTHTSIVSGISGLLVSHLQASHQRIPAFARSANLCEQTVRNFLNGDTKNPTLRTCVQILNSCKRLEDLMDIKLLRSYSGLAAKVIRLHEKRKRIAKRRAA